MRVHSWNWFLIALLVFAVLAAPAASVQSACVTGLTDDDIYTNDNTTFCEVTPSDLCGETVPLLSPWAAALLVSLLVVAGFVILRRRTKTANALFLGILLFTVLFSSFYVTAWKVQAHEIVTSEDHYVTHYHRGERELTTGEKDCINGMISIAYPLATRTGEPTIRYNAHGYTFDQSRSWILPDQVPFPILTDDYVAVTGARQVGDVIVYWDGASMSSVAIGSGIVREVDGEGNVIRVEAKWGIAGTYLHAPDYGVYYNLSMVYDYWRYAP